ncbi:DUF2157 domain-containing protein [Laspinema olomoucense]|uniref:DUF2157 domain-containing protein n=1 Tax=Laspinema olomoucense TaxID=3231600 RepID=UPI0021BB19D0|nr:MULTISPECIES: DUF2157 domain-containing protein [unclassified Laspinema]MCT7971320.1 hypothetical protein [Laspinema sp. D3d]MCT7987670.1 hypothetical protein [Laspinema sp. D3a]
MKIFKKDIDWAVSEGILSSEQGESLWNALQKRTSNRPQFNFANVAYYFGAFIVLSGMTWFMTLAWEQFGGKGLLFLACFYTFLFVLAGQTLWFKQNLKIPGGLLFTIAVCMTPLAIFGLLTQVESWPNPYVADDYSTYFIQETSRLILMELGTILAGLITVKFIKFPFLMAPITLASGFLSIHVTAAIIFYYTGQTGWYSQENWVFFWFGLSCLIVAYCVDVKTSRLEEDYSFWLYLFGLISFWFSMTFMGIGYYWNPFIYLLINFVLILLSVLLHRRVFIVFGTLGISYLLYDLSYRTFQGSLLFPLTLMVLGLLVIYAGIQYQRNEEAIERLIVGNLPRTIRDILPRRRS